MDPTITETVDEPEVDIALLEDGDDAGTPEETATPEPEVDPTPEPEVPQQVQEGAQAAPAPSPDEGYSLTYRGEQRSYNREGITNLAQQGLALQAQREAIAPALNYLADLGVIDSNGNVLPASVNGNPVYVNGRPISMLEQLQAVVAAQLDAASHAAPAAAGVTAEKLAALQEDFPEIAEVLATQAKSVAGYGQEIGTLKAQLGQMLHASQMAAEAERADAVRAEEARVTETFKGIGTAYPLLQNAKNMRGFMEWLGQFNLTYGHITPAFLAQSAPVFLAQSGLNQSQTAQLHGEAGGPRASVNRTPFDDEIDVLME